MIDEKLSLSDYLRWTFVSCKMGVRKPNTAAYEIVEERFRVPPDKILFVDNKLKNIEEAKKRGFMTHKFTDSDTLKKELEDRKLLP